jgi:hypothetical protein
MKKIIFILVVFCAVSIDNAAAQWGIHNSPNGDFAPGVVLSDINNSKIQIGVATCLRCYSEQAKEKDVVFRTVGGGNTIFSFFQAFSSSDTRKIIFAREDASVMEVSASGKVKIGDVATPGDYRLYVEKGILTEKVRVAVSTSSSWADYVFDKSYRLPTLSYVEKYIKANKHLPNVPSAQDVVKDGIDIMQMQSKLLEKIEELTLYMIEANKKTQELEAEVKKLKGQKKP